MRYRSYVFALFISIMSLATPQAGSSQSILPEENGRVLAGVRVVDARTAFVVWLDMGEDKDRIRSNVQSAFELGLRRDGITVSADAPNYLFCRLSFARSGGSIAYAYSIEYFEFVLNGVQRLAWRTSGIVTVGRNSFNPDDVARDCIDAFANEWLKWNPRGG